MKLARGRLRSLGVGLVIAAFATTSWAAGLCNLSDEEMSALVQQANADLAAAGWNVAIEQIDCYTIGQGRPSFRVHAQEFRWVPNDTRREAQGTDLTYIVDQSAAGTSSGVSPVAAEAAIDRAAESWNADGCLSDVSIEKRADPGTDITIFDGILLGDPTLIGDPFQADVVQAGWFPAGPPFFGEGDIGFSITLIFRDPITDEPTDVNGDNRLDTALNEVYFNDGLDWGIDVNLPQFDVESDALHEWGHSLGLGHFGPPPLAVMNAEYPGLLQVLQPIDSAGACTVWSSWPSK